jgi:adenylate cyclase
MTLSLHKQIKKHWKLSVLLFLSWSTLTVFYAFGFLGLWQLKMYDRFFTKKTPPSDIVILSIDDETISRLGGWPLKRAGYVKVLNNTKLAKALAFDVSFADASNVGQSDDILFANALKNSKIPIYLASQFDDRGGKVTLPLLVFQKVSNISYANILLDSDGIVRSIKSKIGEDESISLSLLGKDSENKKNIPPKLIIDFYGPKKTFPYIPLIDVWQGLIPESVFRDKIVLVGATAPDLHDILNTPTGVMPGVEVHANALATMKGGKFYKPLSWPVVSLLILFFDLLAIIVIIRFKRIATMVSLLALTFCAIQILSIVAFKSFVQIPNIYISISFLLTSGLFVVNQYFTESKDKKMIRNMFQYYLTPEIIDELVQNPEKLKLGGEKKQMTVLFSDIRNFSSISEKIEPELLTQLLNEYLTDMTEAVMHSKGFVDKYIGDAVMAFWGAPGENKFHAKDACNAALHMHEHLMNLNKSWKEKGFPHLSIGIGINTGNMVVGNIGSSRRFNYTIIGDEVNLGSRLEGLNKIYGTECIISESTYAEIKNENFTVRELDYVTVKGKTEPKKIFELITRHMDEAFTKILEEFSRGRELYVKGEFKKAGDHFKKALSLGSDGPSSVFLERCIELEKNAPATWSGLYEFKVK